MTGFKDRTKYLFVFCMNVSILFNFKFIVEKNVQNVLGLTLISLKYWAYKVAISKFHDPFTLNRLVKTQIRPLFFITMYTLLNFLRFKTFLLNL